MNYFATFIIIGEALLSFYKYLAPRSYFGPNIFDIILGLVFLGLAALVLTKPQNRILQWVAIILSLWLGPGGFIGFGGIAAVLLAVIFIAASKKSGTATN